MRKELGKWFMDIAKYLLTAVVVGALISDIENSRWLVYVGGIGATLSCLFIGLGLLRQKETNKTQEEYVWRHFGFLFLLLLLQWQY